MSVVLVAEALLGRAERGCGGYSSTASELSQLKLKGPVWDLAAPTDNGKNVASIVHVSDGLY